MIIFDSIRVIRGGPVFKDDPEEDCVPLDGVLSRNILEVNSTLDQAKWEECDKEEEDLLGGDEEVLKMFRVVFLEAESELSFGKSRAIVFKEKRQRKDETTAKFQTKRESDW